MAKGLLAAVLGGEDYETKESCKKPNGYWTKEKINDAFYDSINKLKRIPTCREINGSAFIAIKNGIIPGVKTYNQFLEYQGFEPNKVRGQSKTSVEINGVFYSKINKLKRLPLAEEMKGVISGLKRGLFPGIKTYNQFVRSQGLEVNFNQNRYLNLTFDNWAEEFSKHPEWGGMNNRELVKNREGWNVSCGLSAWLRRITKDQYERRIIKQMILGRKLNGMNHSAKNQSLLSEVLRA